MRATGTAAQLTRFAVCRRGNELLTLHAFGKLPVSALLLRSRICSRCIDAQPEGNVLPGSEQSSVVHSSLRLCASVQQDYVLALCHMMLLSRAGRACALGSAEGQFLGVCRSCWY